MSTRSAAPAEIQPASVQAIIPTRNEEATIGLVIRSLREQGITRIRVVDNGSSDRSAAIALGAGAEVVSETRRGYGQACWTGLQEPPVDTEWVLFCDADGSDALEELPRFFEAAREADLVLGNRRSTAGGRHALTTVQDFGNGLATALLRLGWGRKYDDLGPLRLIRRTALNSIKMEDRGFGWTVEMQARAIEEGLRINEIPVRYKERQGGKSKISGTISGSVKAGVVIFGTLGKFYARKLGRTFALPRCQQILLFLSALLLAVGSFVMQPVGDFQRTGTVPIFLSGAGIMGLGFLASLAVREMSWRVFWGVALITRLILLPMYPGDDAWRYLWEGMIQQHGYNPYLLAPLAPELEHLRTPWWPLINHPEVSAVYPPLAQLGFKLLTVFMPSVLVLKLGAVLADLGCCVLLQRFFGNKSASLYAWNPLVIYCFAGGGHYDAWFLFSMVAGWLWLVEKPTRVAFVAGSLCLGASVAFKYVSFPLVLHKGLEIYRTNGFPKALAFCLIALVPFAIPFWVFVENAPPRDWFPTNFLNTARSSEFIPYWIGLIWPASTRMNWIFGITVIVTVPFLLSAKKRFCQFSEAYFFILLLLSPVIHAWYFTWLAPFVVKSRNPGIVLVSFSGFLYFLLQQRQAQQGDWYQSVSVKCLLWLPLIVGFLWQAARESRTWQKR